MLGARTDTHKVEGMFSKAMGAQNGKYLVQD